MKKLLLSMFFVPVLINASKSCDSKDITRIKAQALLEKRNQESFWQCMRGQAPRS